MLEGLESLPSLQTLEVNKNALKDISYLSTIHLENLRMLNVSCNTISDLDGIAYTICSLKSLQSLDAYGNPIESDFRYRFKLAENSRLAELDGVSVTEAMRKELEVLENSLSLSLC